MPYADVSDALTDPEIADPMLSCMRTTNLVGANGLNGGASTQFFFTGVVTQAGGHVLERTAVGSSQSATISIVTRTRLFSGNATYQADVVTWRGSQYTIRQVDNYSSYGRGFYQALADLVQITG